MSLELNNAVDSLIIKMELYIAIDNDYTIVGMKDAINNFKRKREEIENIESRKSKSELKKCWYYNEF